MKYTLFLVLFVLFAASCKKGELPVPKHDSGSVITTAVNMESNYKYQIYFDLKTNTVVGQNLKSAWDLGFEAAPEGNHIILNGSKAMYAFDTEETDFNSVTDTLGFMAGRSWDEPSGNLDSTAVGEWEGTNHVYIIDRGYNENGIHQGFRKIVFESVDQDSYHVKFAALNGTGLTNLTFDKDNAYNFAFLSFTTSGTVMIEPPKADWDLVFTQYVHVFYEPELTTYLVTGCLLNHSGTRSVYDGVSLFSDISFNDIPNYSFTSAVNTIGYEWKEFDGTNYIVHSEKNYIIEDREGLHYKLHFIDFYNNSGVKGNPKWEYQQL